MGSKNNSFAALCRAGRAALGWSQTQLGQETNLAVTSIARIETGVINPRHDTVIKIVRAFQKAGLDVAQDHPIGGFTIVAKPDLFN